MLPLLLFAIVAVDYPGTLDPKLALVDASWGTFVFKAETRPKPGTREWAGTLPETNTPVRIAEDPKGRAVAFVGGKRYPFHAMPVASGFAAQVCFDIPLKGKTYAVYPDCIRLYDRVKSVMADHSRYLDLGVSPWVLGTVQVNSGSVRVGYEYVLRRDKVDPRSGWLGVDSDGNGSIDFTSNSPETAFAEHEDVVFRAGKAFVSTASIDLKAQTVVLRSHPETDYVRIELRPGVALPDWNFTDLAGRPGTLLDYRGKYVMLDVWTSTCGPCLGEVDMLRDMTKRFGGRGFEILGVLGDDELAAAKRVVEENKVTWRTAASPATLTYAEKRLRIASWPTHILLDPQGRILTTEDLRDESLAKTLDRLLPK